MDRENKNLSTAKQELLTNQLSRNKVNEESYQKSIDYKTEIEELIKNRELLNVRVNDLTSETEKLRKDLETARCENVSLTDENIDLATEIEKVRKEYSVSDESNRVEIDTLKSEVNRLVATNSENHHRIEELQKAYDTKANDISTNNAHKKLEADLIVALTDLESKIQECQQAQEIHKQLVNDNRILSAKLTKHREMTNVREEEWEKERQALMERSDNLIKENRFELEGKLIKMKEKMVSSKFSVAFHLSCVSFWFLSLKNICTVRFASKLRKIPGPYLASFQIFYYSVPIAHPPLLNFPMLNTQSFFQFASTHLHTSTTHTHTLLLNYF